MHSREVCIASKDRKIKKISTSPYFKAISISGKREGFYAVYHKESQRILYILTGAYTSEIQGLFKIKTLKLFFSSPFEIHSHETESNTKWKH
jgi:hypothetical protein